MIVIGFAGTRADEASTREVRAMIRAGRLGGVVFFGENIVSPRQLGALAASLLAEGGGRPPFIAIDQEGGGIQRLNRRKGFRGLPSARAMARRDVPTAFGLYEKAAAELAGLHVNVNFGPVVDLDINPANPAIGRKARSYGTDPATVVAFARSFIEAHHAEGVLTAAKHFPGHGSALHDSHVRAVDIARTWQDAEIEPFAELAREGEVDMIMVGHLTHPRFSDDGLPASLSRRALTDELRVHLGFRGLVVTDDLGMSAITSRHKVEDAAVLAIAAGADIVLLANRSEPDPKAADRIAAAVAGAVAAGRIPAALIDLSYDRILAAKRRIGVVSPVVTGDGS